MNITTDITEKHQAKLTVEIDEISLEKAKQRAGRKIAGKIKIPGFRPGKAPYSVVLRQVGEGAILEQAIEDIVDQDYKNIIEQSGIKPYGPGSLENVVSSDPLTIEFLVPLEPEAILGDYHSIRRDYTPDEITDADRERVLQDLMERQVVEEPVERLAQEGDMVSAKISGEKLVDDDDQDKILFSETSRVILIRASQDNEKYEWPFKGFSRNCIGLRAGEGKTVTYTYSDDYEVSSLQGVEARFDFVIDQVRSRRLPELNDEFAASVGEFETLEALNNAIDESLSNQSQSEYNQNYDEQVMDELIEMSTFKYPPEALENALEDVINGFTQRLERQGMTLDLYFKTRSLDMDAFKEETRPAAERQLKRSLALLELAKQEDIVLDPQELNSQAENTLNYLGSTMSKTEARRLNDRRVVSNIISNIAADMLLDKAIGRLRGIANGTYIPESAVTEAEQPAPVELETVELDRSTE